MQTERRFDAIVVGSGAAGGWAAKELTERGMHVLLLEAGRALDPDVDFPLPPPPESRLLARLTAGLTRQPTQMRCAVFNARTRRFFVDDRQSPYSTPADKPFNWFRGRQIGGRLHLWARLVVRLSDLDLKGASSDAYGVDWPLTYADLVPYYEHVETFLGIDGRSDGLPQVPDCVYAGATSLTAEEEAFRTAVESRLRDRRVIAARVARHDVERVPRALRAAQASGRLVCRSDAIASHVLLEPGERRASGVAYVDRLTGQRGEAHGGTVVLCASTIETLRILLNSRSGRHPNGVGNSNGSLGRGLMDHVMIALAGPAPAGPRPLDPDADPYDFGRATGFFVPRFRNLGEARAGFRRGYMLQGGIGRGPGWYMLAHGEMLSRPENRVTLDASKRDAWGIPVPHIECTPSSNEEAMIADARAAMEEMAAAAGLEVRMPPSGTLLARLALRLWQRRLFARSGAFLPGSAVHEIGGAPMGDAPEISVTNRFGQVWDVPNVVVADGACFPSGCCQNVTLTIMALAARACAHLAQS